MSNKTYGYIKKRILDLLCENNVGECAAEDISREGIIGLIPDTLNACICRMYESLPVGKAEAVCSVRESELYGLMSVALPQDFFSLVSVNGENGAGFKIIGGVLYLPDIFHGSVCVVYKKAPPQVDENTGDEFEFDMTGLEAEALCSLTAAELCRPEESAIYTRLIYKYSDLSEGIYNIGREACGRVNRFYGTEKKRWS